MKTRQIITGTLLTAALVMGGSGLATADPGSRPAMDRGTVDCTELTEQLDELAARHDRLVDRIFTLEARRDAAVAAGQVRRAAGLQAAIDAHVGIQARVDARLERIRGVYDANCNTGT